MDNTDSFSAKQTLRRLRRRLAEMRRLLHLWSDAVLTQRRETNIEVFKLLKEPLPESIPLECFDCCELLKGALIVERIAMMQRELEVFEQNVRQLATLSRGRQYQPQV